MIKDRSKIHIAFQLINTGRIKTYGVLKSGGIFSGHEQSASQDPFGKFSTQ